MGRPEVGAPAPPAEPRGAVTGSQITQIMSLMSSAADADGEGD